MDMLRLWAKGRCRVFLPLALALLVIGMLFAGAGGVSAQDPHDPIYIEGDDDFTPANGVVDGSGTEEDPYIIENWDIDASSAHGIHIVSTAAYFIVRNCLVENGGNTNYGIYLENVTNGRVENTVTNNNTYGIYLYRSYNNTIDNNTASNHLEFGICLEDSDNNILTSNYALNNSNLSGIFIIYSDNNILTSNYALNNFYGIELWSSSNNTLTSNYALNNGLGIELNGSYNNTLTGNNASNNGDGIRLFDSENNTLINNTTMSNTSIYGGIWLYCSRNNTLTSNTTLNNSGAGIYLHHGSDSNTLMSNTVTSNNSYGISLYDSDGNLIYNNYFSNAHNAHDYCNNTWNIDPPELGLNIVGGPLLGGNYWSDYEGEDIDGDGLGDTLLPYASSGEIINGGDYHPLLPDNMPPSITDLTPENNSYVSNDTPTISARVSDDFSGIDADSIVMMLDGSEVTPSYNSATGLVSYTPSTPLAESSDPHVVTLTLSDEAGNEASASWQFWVDTTAPRIENLRVLPSSPTFPPSSSRYRISYILVDELSPTCQVVVWAYNRLTHAREVIYSGTETASPSGVAHEHEWDGTYGSQTVVVVRATDQAGNSTTVMSRRLVISSILPTEGSGSKGGGERTFSDRELRGPLGARGFERPFGKGRL